MPANLDPTLRENLRNRLAFYEDIGLGEFYRGRTSSAAPKVLQPHQTAPPRGESTLAKSVSKSQQFERPASAPSQAKPPALPLPTAAAPSLFAAAGAISADTLPIVRADLGECTRCKLHSTRHKIVFGDGSAGAQLIFVGEGPGADEDAQGLPFVGRAGKLLTQMIEAMGLKREQVYICNVVKCRPPGNRQPEKDEVDACSPFLFRQLDVLQPKVIVCLGA